MLIFLIFSKKNLEKPIPTHPKRLLETTIIRYILALRHPAVHVHVHLVDLVAGILIDDALRPLPERLDGGVVPPLHHVALLVELPSLVVEAVGDLVANDHADAPVIQGLGEVLAIKKRLQNASGKY